MVVAQPRAAHRVEIATVSSRQAGTQAAVLNATGYVTARRRATVSSKITGKVVQVNIEEGMTVKEGQVLARLDDDTQRASVALAEAQAEAARKNVNESEVRLIEARINLARLTKLVGVGYRRRPRSTRPARPSTRSRRASAPLRNRCAWPSGRSRSTARIWTARSSARPSRAW